MNNVRIRNFGLTNDPPCLYVYYYVNNGKSRRRKIPVREIPRGIREGVFTLDLDRMVDELLKRHGEYLQQIPQETLLDALARMLNFQHLDTVSRKYKLPLVTHENHPVAYPLKKSSTDSKQHAPKPPNVTGAKPALDKEIFNFGDEWEKNFSKIKQDNVEEPMPPKPAPLTRKLTPMWTEPPPLKDSIHLKHRSLSLEEIKELLAADSPPNDSSQDSLLKDKSHNSISTNESNEKLDHLIKSDTYPPKVNVLRPPQASAKQTLTSLAELPALPSLNKYIPDSTAYEDDFDEGLTDNDEEEFEYSDESILNE